MNEPQPAAVQSLSWTYWHRVHNGTTHTPGPPGAIQKKTTLFYIVTVSVVGVILPRSTTVLGRPSNWKLQSRPMAGSQLRCGAQQRDGSFALTSQQSWSICKGLITHGGLKALP